MPDAIQYLSREEVKRKLETAFKQPNPLIEQIRYAKATLKQVCLELRWLNEALDAAAINSLAVKHRAYQWDPEGNVYEDIPALVCRTITTALRRRISELNRFRKQLERKQAETQGQLKLSYQQMLTTDSKSVHKTDVRYALSRLVRNL